MLLQSSIDVAHILNHQERLPQSTQTKNEEMCCFQLNKLIMLLVGQWDKQMFRTFIEETTVSRF